MNKKKHKVFQQSMIDVNVPCVLVCLKRVVFLFKGKRKSLFNEE